MNISKGKLAKLNEKYGSVTKNFVSGESSKTKDARKVNIGHLSMKQLNDMLEMIKIKEESKRKINMNGKVGITKHNNYTPDKSKDEASESIINHIRQVNNHPDLKVRRIRSDNETEFKNSIMRNQAGQSGKFGAKSDEGIFVGYVVGKAYRVYNLKTNIVMESVHVIFDDKNIEGLKDEYFYERLKFDNVEMYVDDSDDESDQEGMTKDYSNLPSNEATTVNTQSAASVERQSTESVERQAGSVEDSNFMAFTGLLVPSRKECICG
ncbi:hypothetical protein AgCh_009543 [Apium graveolens]